jgi:hypothetical protein
MQAAHCFHVGRVLEKSTYTVRLTHRDLLRASLLMLYVRPTAYLLRGFIFIGILALELASSRHAAIVAAFSAIAAVLAFEALMFAIACVLAGFQARGGENNGFVGEHKFTIGVDGLTEETVANKTLHRWPFVGRPRKRGRFIFIPVRGVGIHFLPIRDLGPRAAHLVEQVEAHRAKSATPQAIE